MFTCTLKLKNLGLIITENLDKFKISKPKYNFEVLDVYKLLEK
jgi:hypothetical protein